MRRLVLATVLVVLAGPASAVARTRPLTVAQGHRAVHRFVGPSWTVRSCHRFNHREVICTVGGWDATADAYFSDGAVVAQKHGGMIRCAFLDVENQPATAWHRCAPV